MDIQFDLLKKISETPGVPGYESKIRELIINEVKPIVDELSVDNLGNVVAIKKGKGGKKVMAAAHMDEIGFMVQHIDKEGFIRFVPLGGFDPKTLTSQRVVVHGKKDLIGVMGSKPIHIMTDEEKKKVPELKDYFIDLGMKKEEVEKYVEVGDPITRERELIEMGDCVNGKSLDNRVSVYILIEVLKSLKNKEIPYDFYGVFTVQEEVGLRGAQVATLDIQPDFGFAVDTCVAFDLPIAQEHQRLTSLGEGAAIKVLDAHTIADYRMVKYMKEIAGKHEIKWQTDLSPKGGTDTAHLQRMRKGGSIAGAVSIPTRHIHQVIETINKQDIASAIQLLEQCVLNVGDYDWSH